MKTSWITCMALAVAVAIGVGCDDDDDPIRPIDDEFSLTVRVVDVDGDPVEGLNVVVWNMSSELEAALQDAIFRRRAATTVRFQLERGAVCDLVVDDLNGLRAQTVIENAYLPVGAHSVVVGADITYEAGVEVFSYRLTVRDQETDEEIFEDSRFMTAVHLDPSRLTAKPTDPDGEWITRDLTFVPGLRQTLPRMPIVDESGEESGSFAIADTVYVRVVDEEGRFLQKIATVGRSSTTVEFTWDPSLLRGGADGPEAIDFVGPSSAPASRELPPAVTRLYQNSPNPFN